MTIEICAVGGYNEVGKNMTAIKVDDEVVIVDMGLFLPAVINLTEEERVGGMNYPQLKRIGAIPNILPIKKWQDKVVAIALGHCHLDHIGAIPYMGELFNAPIIGTPFTLQVLRKILEDEKVKLPNKLKPLAPDSSIRVSKNITIELINITHSTPQSTMVAVHTKYGTIVYANDFKFDSHPVIGTKPNYARLKALGKKGVIAVIVESLYADREGKTPSERVAKELLKNVLMNTDNRGKAIIVSTFASHLARINSAIEFAKRLHRKVIVLGRSMGKYIAAGEDIKIINFTKSITLGTYKSEIKKHLAHIEKNRGEYLVICTGNQAEPNSVLDRIVNKEFKFQFKEGDQVIFSSKVIPADINKKNRSIMEEKLKAQRVRIFKDIHVSGHASIEDLRDFLNMLKPGKIIPAHGEDRMKNSFSKLAKEEGYKAKDILILNDGDIVKIQ